jgi:alkanesulfonate monooxygenase SsuD/methylene tetrahydromethanopterin reductase-like flavin-dependent oxidoreductase (luciferase family)
LPTWFGIQTVQNRPWPEILDLWSRFEDMGFDSLWLPDHLVRPFEISDPFLEAWTLLAALANATHHIRLGVLVSCNTFRSPVLLAKQSVTVDHISGGRLELGIGAGWFAGEHEMFGIPLPEPQERVDRYREAIEIVDRLLRGGIQSYAGACYQLNNAVFHPAPVQRPRPPLTLGAHGPRLLGIAARYADRWNTVGTVAEVKERNRILDEHCSQLKRDPSEIRRSLLFVPAQMPGECPWQSLDAFADFTGRYREAGIEEFILQPPPTALMPQLERVVAELLPALRAAP